jgi:hypothetical protein
MAFLNTSGAFRFIGGAISLAKPVAGPTYHPEALAWRTAALANGGTVSTATIQAVSDFCTAIDAADIRSSFLRLNLVCGGNLAAARTPLYRGASATGTQYGAAIDTNVGPYASGDYTQSTGLTGDGASKYLDTTLTIGTLATFGADYGNVHASVYNRTSDYGPQFGGSDYNGFYNSNACALECGTVASLGDTAAYFQSGTSSNGDHDMYAATVGYGFTLALFSSAATGLMARQGAALSVTVRNAGAAAFETTDGTPLLFGGCWSSYDYGNGVVPNPWYADGAVAAYSVGTVGNLSFSGGRTAFYNAMIAFQAALGRNV